MSQKISIKELLTESEMNETYDNVVIIKNNFASESEISFTSKIHQQGVFTQTQIVVNLLEIVNTILLENKYDIRTIDIHKAISKVKNIVKQGALKDAN